jgi:hypothetical protein
MSRRIQSPEVDHVLKPYGRDTKYPGVGLYSWSVTRLVVRHGAENKAWPCRSRPLISRSLVSLADSVQNRTPGIPNIAWSIGPPLHSTRSRRRVLFRSPQICRSQISFSRIIRPVLRSRPASWIAASTRVNPDLGGRKLPTCKRERLVAGLSVSVFPYSHGTALIALSVSLGEVI